MKFTSLSTFIFVGNHPAAHIEITIPLSKQFYLSFISDSLTHSLLIADNTDFLPFLLQFLIAGNACPFAHKIKVFRYFRMLGVYFVQHFGI